MTPPNATSRAETPGSTNSVQPDSAPEHPNPFAAFARAIWAAVGGDPALLAALSQTSPGALPSAFAVSDLAAASVGCAGLAIAELSGLIRAQGRNAAPVTPVTVDRRLASAWFSSGYRPVGWEPAAKWDAIAGDYPGQDGWIRLHTNAPHHRRAALAVLGITTKDATWQTVAATVANWPVTALETAIVEKGGCAAAMRSLGEWQQHPQGKAVASEPLVHAGTCPLPAAERGENSQFRLTRTFDRPLAGVKVLDLTRILAGPVGTRFLAGFGANVLRIDPPGWDEPTILPDITVGKRCARLDLINDQDRETFRNLLAEADILVHGYRADALERLGLGTRARRALNPGLIDVALNAYGWSGPWQFRRGFDSLVQMSSGIADHGMKIYQTEKPKPLPVQALDHAAGYIVATCAIRGLIERHQNGHGLQYRTSLARVAALLCQYQPTLAKGTTPPAFTDLADDDYSPAIEPSGSGNLQRLRPPLEMAGIPMGWTIPAGLLGTSPPVW
ncbi:CoA transferase [Thalassospira marina]|uniref:Acyl-CoA transferase n=1 Tax=Thalassospira marina TaxID=2048283 RepID=A0A2N3KX09_9PROT|nr:CoA transferase [Thalassospira marina]PKR55121.1 acyl-CoA transferase [Thalassospira marina]